MMRTFYDNYVSFEQNYIRFLVLADVTFVLSAI